MVDSTNEAAAVELLPCPFCKDGGTPSVYAPNPHVWCLTCDCAGPHLDTPEEAVSAWNARAAIAAHAAALAGEVVACHIHDYGDRVRVVWDKPWDTFPVGTKFYSHPTSAPDVAALSDEAIERALDTPMTLDHTLRQLIRGDTMAVGTSKVHVVRTLLNALKAAQQETSHAKA